MKKFLKPTLAASVAAVVVATTLAASVASAAPLAYQTVLLLNGWKTYSSSVRAAKVAVDAEGIVHFLGAIGGGSDHHAFTLDPQFRPNKAVNLHTNLCNAAPGRIAIGPDGTVGIYAPTLTLGDPTCFTSLEGVTFALQ